MADANNVLITATDSQVKVDNVDIGYTQGGVSMKVTAEKHRVKADQAMAPIKSKTISREAVISMNFLEATLENLRIAWGLPSGNLASGVLTIDNAESPEFKLEIIGDAPSGATRTATFNKCETIQVGDIVQGDTETLIPVEFHALWDGSNSEFGNITDV